MKYRIVELFGSKRIEGGHGFKAQKKWFLFWYDLKFYASSLDMDLTYYAATLQDAMDFIDHCKKIDIVNQVKAKKVIVYNGNLTNVENKGFATVKK